MSGENLKRVVICGGGVAALEALLGLRALLEVRIEVHWIAPNRQFVYQPLAVAAPFGLAETHLFDLAEIAEEKGARLHEDSLAHVDSERRLVRMSSGAVLPYDVLLLAIGAQPQEWLPGALHFSGAESVRDFRRLLERLEVGADHRVCFVNPPGVSWTLPLYELALLTASHLADAGVIGAELTLVTPEEDPLGVFGPSASRMLRNLLADRGIRLKAGVYAEEIDGSELHTRPAGKLEVDQVITLAHLNGLAIPGLPADAEGFLVVDDYSRVLGLEDVYAAGDGTNFPLKQGGIAAQQADVAAEVIAAGIGAAVEPSPIRHTLRGMLLTGIAPIYMRAQIAGREGDSFETAPDPLWWPPSKIAGRHLAPYLASRSPFARDEQLRDRAASKRDPAKLREAHDEARALALTFAERDAADRHFKSALQWLEVLERLDGVLPPGFARRRADWQEHVGAKRRT